MTSCYRNVVELSVGMYQSYQLRREAQLPLIDDMQSMIEAGGLTLQAFSILVRIIARLSGYCIVSQ